MALMDWLYVVDQFRVYTKTYKSEYDFLEAEETKVSFRFNLLLFYIQNFCVLTKIYIVEIFEEEQSNQLKLNIPRHFW